MKEEIKEDLPTVTEFQQKTYGVGRTITNPPNK
jgi:hypothetical protein